MISDLFFIIKYVVILLIGLALASMGTKETVNRLRGPVEYSQQQLINASADSTSRLVRFQCKLLSEEPIGNVTTVRKKHGVEKSRSVTSQFYVAVLGDKLLLIESDDKPNSNSFVGRFENLTEEHRTKILDDLPSEIVLPFRIVEIKNYGWTDGGGLFLLAFGVTLLAYSAFQLRKSLGNVKAQNESQENIADVPIVRSVRRDVVPASPHHFSHSQPPSGVREPQLHKSVPDASDNLQRKQPKSSGPSITFHVQGKRPITLQLNDEIVIGRSQECEVSIEEDKQASKKHASVRLRNGRLVLQDLESSNGTFLNGSKVIGLEPIADGDSIVVGRSEIRVAF